MLFQLIYSEEKYATDIVSVAFFFAEITKDTTF